MLLPEHPETEIFYYFLMKSSHAFHIHITARPENYHLFLQFLMKGFRIKARSGCSIFDLLCLQLRLDRDYVEKKIQTLFLNEKSIDDMYSTRIPAGSILALSAAMPGLVGASFRRGGYYSSLRSQISHQDVPEASPIVDTEITLKLFNIVARDLGPYFLSMGILISGEDFEDIILSKSDDSIVDGMLVIVDGRQVDKKVLMKMKWKDSDVILQVET
jgi:hypothetical protein